MSQQKTIALQLRTLAADPDSQGLLLKEASCLTGLVALLHADNEEDVLILSLQALQFLAGPHQHHAQLVNQPGLIMALTLLTDKPSITIKSLAQNVLDKLEAYINGTPASANAAASGTSTPARSSSIHSRAGSRGGTKPGTPATRTSDASSVSSASSTAGPRYLSQVQFHISTSSNTTTLDKLSQQDIERALVQIKGVISITYSASTGKPIFSLYTSLRPPVLSPLVLKAVNDLHAGFVVHMLNKDGSVAAGSDKENQENDVPIKSSAAASSSSASGKPSYLKKNSTSSTAPGYLNSSSSSSSSSRALTNHSTVTSASDSANGLAARYQQNKKGSGSVSGKEQQGADGKKGLFSGITSYFW